MSNITPFKFDNHSVRVITDENGEPLFVGKDICDALGYADHVNALKQHCRGVVKRHPIADNLGRMQETRVLTEPDMMRLIVNSTLPAAQEFERLVFEEILPTIRKTGKYISPGAEKKQDAQDAFKLVPMVVRAARALGLDRNAAAISANQVVTKMTGTNVLQLLGHTRLDNETQTLFFTPTELGERMGISGRKFNMLLAEAGLQAKKGEHWCPMATAEGFVRVLDTGKRHGDGTMIQQVKWSDAVLKLVKQAA